MGPVTQFSEQCDVKNVVDGQGKTALVVEDNHLNMVLFHDILQASGFEVLRAETGAEGWRLVQAHRPDLIVMDIQLPDFSGLEVTRRVKADESLRTIPVLAVTAFAMVGDREKYLAGGCDAYVSKPVSVGDFLAAVARMLDSAATSAEEDPGQAAVDRQAS